MDLSDGLTVFTDHAAGIAIFVLCIVGLGAWAVRLALPEAVNSPLARLLLVPPLGSLALTWVAVGLVIFGRLRPEVLGPGGPAIVILSALALLREVWLGKAKFTAWRLPWWAWLLLTAFGIWSLLRLGFLADLLLPPYVDSASHYAIVRDLLSPDTPPGAFYSLANLTSHYYHFGFHALAAWLSLASGLSPSDAIGLLGQLFLVIAPLSILLLAYVGTGNLSAGLAAAGFAGLAWRMPYFAANWGKYPAIAGLSLLPGVLGFGLIISRLSKRPRSAVLILALAAMSLGLLHTRLLICLALAALAYRLSAAANGEKAPGFGGALALTVIPGAGLLVFWSPALRIFYASGYYVPLVLLVLLLPFALLHFPRFALASAVFLLGLWLAGQAPFPFSEHGLTWLDPPFLQSVLYIPLAVLGGLGFGGLLRSLSGKPSGQWCAAAGLGAGLMLGFLGAGGLKPDPCCNFVHPADLRAIAWLGEHSTPQAIVWIAGFKPRNYMLGTDAGVWVRPLTGRNANQLRYDFPWDSASARVEVCRPYYREVFIFRGSMPFSFREAAPVSSAWLSTVFEESQTRIYRANCDLHP